MRTKSGSWLELTRKKVRVKSFISNLPFAIVPDNFNLNLVSKAHPEKAKAFPTKPYPCRLLILEVKSFASML